MSYSTSPWHKTDAGVAPKSRDSIRTLDQLLAQSVWFPALSAEACQGVRHNMRELEIPAGKPLCQRGDKPLHWYGAIDGLLKWSVSHATGRTVTLGGLSAGSWFGEGALMSGDPRTADIVALRPSRVAIMSEEMFSWLRVHEPSFTEFLLRQINERMQWFMGTFSAQHLQDTDSNVARALAGLFHPWLHPGSAPRLRTTQEEIANLSGLSRQRCNAALRRLANTGVIVVEYGGIRIVNLQELRRRAQIQGSTQS